MKNRRENEYKKKKKQQRKKKRQASDSKMININTTVSVTTLKRKRESKSSASQGLPSWHHFPVNTQMSEVGGGGKPVGESRRALLGRLQGKTKTIARDKKPVKYWVMQIHSDRKQKRGQQVIVEWGELPWGTMKEFWQQISVIVAQHCDGR